MKVVIIEDEAPAFRRLQKILEEIDPNIELLEVIDSVEEAVRWFNHNQKPDLIFMDIQLSDGISFDIFEQTHIEAPVIFTTAFDEYMLKAFKVNSIDYLLKPINKDDLKHSLNKYADMKRSFGSTNSSVDLNELINTIKLGDQDYRSRFLIKKGEQMLSVETDDIATFFTKNGVVYIKTIKDHQYILDHTLDEIIQQLDPKKFYRANRQNIVAYKAIQATHKYHKGKLLVELVVKPESPITISAEKATAFKEWLGQ